MKKLSRMTALLLALMMLVTSVPITALAEITLDTSIWENWVSNVKDAFQQAQTTTEAFSTTVDVPVTAQRTVQGYEKEKEYSTADTTAITLMKGATAKLTNAEGAGQWQIAIGEDQWANIAGATGATITLNEGMLMGGAATIRCGNGTPVTVNLSTADVLENADETITVAVTGERVKQTGRKFSASDLGISTFENENVKKTHLIEIQYKLQGQEVANSYTAQIAEGSDHSAIVANPKVVGYIATQGSSELWGNGFVFDEEHNQVQIDVKNISKDMVVTVEYQPTIVDYTVVHYKQNVGDDKYTEMPRETLKGLTGSTVEEVAHVRNNGKEVDEGYEGFYALIYERPAIAADGSTVIEVYYDRYYYLMNFDMDGGYGTEPVYARYGASIGTVTAPTKAGYEFKGWAETKGETDPDKAVKLPETMPAANKTYYAIWEVTDKAKVTVVFWGENADDEKYSYLSNYTKEINLKPGSEFTYSETGMLTCGTGTHTHTDDCYEFICEQEAHEHNNNCYYADGGCKTAEHKHGVGCYPGASSEIPDGASAPWNAPSNPKNGQVLIETHLVVSRKYIYINGNWYTYSGNASSGSSVSTNCGMTEHTHTTACIGCGKTEHVHTRANCYKLTCKEEEHTHTSSCYQQGAGLDSTLWKFVKSDTITVAADGSSVVNVYYDRVEYSVQFYENQNCSSNREYTSLKITAKWGQNILSKWPTYNGSSSWYVKDKSNTWQNSIQVMPVGGAKFWGPKSGNSKYTATYYVEILDGESYDVKGKDDRYYKVHHTDTSNSSGNVTDEERYGIDGFTINNSISTSNGSSYGGSKFYYTRNSYKLTFNDQYDDVKNETVKFEAPLSTYKDYVPEVPSQIEPGSVEFGGWYQNPQCTGEEYKLDEHTMPSHDIILYAKWVPVNRNVKFYLKEGDTEVYTPTGAANAEFTVPHGSTLDEKYVNAHLTQAAMIEAKPNGSYKFVVWYYYEDGVKKYFDPTTQVRSDLTLYGEWSSDTLKEYTVQYVLKDDHSVKVADDLTGSGLAGTTKTFDAKGGTELYAVYQEGYFPTVQSQSLLLDIDKETLTVTFEYVPMPAVPYTVRYVTEETVGEGTPTYGTVTVDGKTYTKLAEDYTNDKNRKAVVTETFKPISGYMPDAYQKRLVVTAEGENILYFYYSKDETHAYYKITHYTQNTDGATWTEYASSQAVGDIGTRYTGSPMTIPGFTYKEIKYVVDGKEVTDVTAEGAKLTADGLEINLYYVRNEYPYQVRYLEQGSGNVLHDPKNGTGKYGEVISETYEPIDGYDLVGEQSQTLNIRIDEGEGAPNLNIITFYYKKKTVEIKYQIVGSEGCGTLSSYVDSNVNVFKGTVNGSVPTANEGYHFVGWFKDEECNEAVTESWVVDNKITPEKTTKIGDKDAFEAKTYYAKFEEDEVTINYVAVGPEGATNFGSVDPTTETVKVKSGTAQGSTPTAGDGFKFVGWFKDEACTEAVDASWVTDNKIVPAKDENGKNVAAIYYAKFEYDVSTLTITKEGMKDKDSAIFKVTVDGKEYTVVLNAEHKSVTLAGLKVGATYSVEEDGSWSNRYTVTKPENTSGTIKAPKEAVTVTFTNTKSNDHWLHDESSAHNVFTGATNN